MSVNEFSDGCSRVAASNPGTSAANVRVAGLFAKSGSPVAMRETFFRSLQELFDPTELLELPDSGYLPKVFSGRSGRARWRRKSDERQTFALPLIAF
jgi:hypothetical protein